MYQGHHPDGGGVQKHSAGATYPFIVAARNDRAEVMGPGGDIVHIVPFAQPITPASRINSYDRAINLAVAQAAVWAGRNAPRS